MTTKTEKTRKRQEAEARQAKYDSLSTENKLELARSRRGNSEREIARLKWSYDA